MKTKKTNIKISEIEVRLIQLVTEMSEYFRYSLSIDNKISGFRVGRINLWQIR